ncbi:MAG: T9SS type A sorting domain-containing protein [Chlorobi bacterium]|nr:T9SS type A sorting domain-containing protein [Chlorobiota bacterium]
MKKLFLLLFLIPVMTFSFSQEIKRVDVKKEKQITKINNDVTVFNKNTFVHPTKISKAVYHDVLPSLKDLPPVTDDYYKEKNRRVADGFEHDEAEGADYSNWKPMGEDPVWQKNQGKIEQNKTKALQQNIVGQTSPYMPSDCNGTVGPNHFFQTVNTTYAIWDKTGTQVVAATAMNTLFNGVTGASNNDGDPLILWDEQASRWVAVEFSITGGPPYYMLIAVSQSSDPTLGWDRWSFTMNGMPDYEKLGIASDGYYMGTNTTTGDDIYVFERSVMIAGGASPQMLQFDNPNRPNPSGFNCVMPIDNDGTFDTGQARFIAINDDAWGGSVNGGDEIWIFDCTPDWATPANSTFGRSQAIVVSAFDSQFQAWGVGDIVQPGETEKVDANPYVLMSRGQYKNISGNEYIVCDHTVDVDNTDHAGIRWYQLQKNAGVWTLKQEGTYAPDGESRWMGSIAMNDYGQIALAYSVSGTVSPEIRYTGQTSCASSGTMDVTEQTVSTSLTPQSQPTYTRWGDYFLTTVDPSDNLTFWSTLEYYNGGKKTQIFSYKIDESCAAPTITSVDYTSLYADRGKNLTITGTDFLGCSFVLNGITGTEVSNDGTTAVINFPPAAYDATNSLVVSNIVGSDNIVVTINTRTTIPVDASAAANSDTHQTISSATDGIAGWLGSNAFTSPITINVAAGTYTESITLNNNLNPTTANPLIIQNSSGTSPVVDATGNNYGFNLGTVDYVTLKGFQVHSANNSNIYSQGSNVTLKYNKTYNAVGDNSGYGLADGNGIKIETGSSITVQNNLAYGNIGSGIKIATNNAVVKNNTTDDNGGLVTHKTGVQLFYETFEDASAWTTTDWGTWTGSLFDATPSKEPAAGILNATDYLTLTNPIDITGYTNLSFSIWVASYGTLESVDIMNAQYSFDGSNWTDIVALSDDHTTFTEYTLTGVTPTSNNLYLRVYGKVGNSEYWFVDDFKVTGDESFSDYYQGNGLLVSSGTGSSVQNNVSSAKTGNTAYHALKLTNSSSISSDYNTYYSLTGTVFDNNGTTGNSGAPLGTNDLTSNPLFVGSGDYHLQSTTGSYTASKAPIWPPDAASGGVWSNDLNDSPAIDAGNPADTYTNELADNGGRINQGVFGNTPQGSKGPPLPCVTPSTQTSAFSASAASSSSIDLSWTRGDGDNVIILAHEAASVDSDPAGGTSYTANAIFGSGTQIGTGNYVVYIGTGNAVTVTGLTSNTAYYFAAYEFNNTDVCYLTPGVTANAATPSTPPSITNVSPNSFFADKGATLTITGSGLGDLTTSVNIAGVAGNVTSNDGSTLVVDFAAGLYTNTTLTVSTGVNPDATSTVTVNTRNVIPVGGGTDYHTTIQSALDGLYAWFGTAAFSTSTAGYLAGTKTIEVYNGTYTDIVTPNVNLGTSASENLIIQNAAGQQPVINASGNANAFYIGALDYVTISGFTAYSSSDAIIYTEGDNNTITLNKLYGSTAGAGIILNNALTTTVQNNLVYNNYTFGIRVIASNNAVIKNNTVADNGNEAKGPPLPSVYTPAQLFVESGTGVSVENNIFYAKTGSNVYTLKTETGITVTSNYNTYYKNGNTNLVFYNGTLYADLAAWTGNGAGTNDLESDPLFVSAGTDFHIQSTFGSYPYPAQWPPEAAGSAWNNDAGSSPALDTGNPADSYANEPAAGGRINQGAFGNTAQASKSVACTYPTTQAANFSTSNITSNSMDINWTRGTGDFVIVLAHEGSAVDADPIDGTTYSANAAFGSGTQIGTGNYVVYIGIAGTSNVTSLNSNTAYYFAVYEFSDANKCYLIPALTGNATTLELNPTITNVSPNNFFADKGATLTITGTNLGNLTTSVDIAGVSGTVTSNDGSTLTVDFGAGLYINNTLTVSTGTSTDATTTVTVNTRNIIPVGGGTDYHTTIQSALDGLYAWFGTAAFSTSTAGYLAGSKTIEVYNGTYTDVVTPNVNLGTSASESLIIQNASGQQPVINASGNANAFYIGALDYVTISGFTAYSSSDALIYTEGDNNTITLNKLYGSTAGAGIILNNALTATVQNNLVYNNYTFGIRVIASNNAVVKNNTVANNGHTAKAPPLPSVYTPAQLYVESGTGVSVENNILYALSGTNVVTLMTETGITVSSDYNTYYKNGNTNLVYYNGTVYADLAAWTGNGAGANDLEGDPLFVNAGTDFHILSTNGSYPYPAEWPPEAAASAWNNDASDSPALDTGDPADAYANEPISGGRINQGAYGNTAQASKSVGIYWDGSTSIDWQTTTNWSPEQIPASTDDIVIPDGMPNYPTVDDGTTTALCNNMTIAANASVTIATNGQMTVSGSITNNRGAAGLIIKSDATGSGSLIVGNTPEATVERFVTGNIWHLMFPALSAVPTTIYTTEGADVNQNFYSYNESNEDYWDASLIYSVTGWTSEVGAANIRTDKGYLFNRYNLPDKTFVQTGGNIAGSDKIFNVSYTVSTVAIGNGVTQTRDYFDGWNLIGNPFTSAVDWDQITVSGIESGVYYFDGINYQYYIPGGGTTPWNVGITLNGGSQYIPSGQGFMVKVANTGLTHSTTVTIPTSARVHNSQTFWKSSKAEIPDFLRLNIEKDGFTDETVIRTLPEGATENHDAKYDAYKMFAWDKTKPQLYSFDTNNSVYAINSVPEIGENKKVIPLGIYIGATGQYQINAVENNFEGFDIYLHDITNDIFTIMSKNANYLFNSEKGTFTDRFELVFEKSSSNTNDISDNDVLLFPNPNKGSFYLSVNNTTDNYRVEITNVTGQLVYQNRFYNSGTNEIKLNTVSDGIYFVKLIFNNNKIINKKIVIE